MMPSRQPNSAGAGPATVGALRVVLVGRTGLDGAVRLDRLADVRRSRTGAEAIGELTDVTPDAAGGRSEVAVVVAPGTLAEDRAASFCEGVRTLCPSARVFGIGRELRDGFAGAIPPGISPQDLARILRGLDPEPARPQERAAAAPARPEVPVSAVTSHPDATAERQMLEAVLSGKDPREVGETLAGRMVGRPLKILRTATDSHSSDAVPIVHASHVLGHLHAPGADREKLVAAAAFLAPWLKLGAQQDQLRAAAFTDELTGAFNRRYFMRFLSAAIDQAREKRHAVTLLIFDVDNFKQYNDTAGHAAGDEILTQTVRLLTSVIRPTDRVCRIGGDEFAVIFHDPDGPRKPESAALMGPRSIGEIAARFQKQITEHRFPKLADKAMPTLTISGGMATFPWDGRTVQELMDRADELAMQSKRQGKNSITYGPGAERECRECP